MKLNNFLFLFIILVLFLSKNVLCNELGLSFGTKFSSEMLEDRVTPKNIFLHYKFDLLSNISIKIGGGYGIGNRSSQVNYSDERFFDTYIRYEIEGFPIELEMLYEAQILNSSYIFPYFGIGMGYYNYDVRTNTVNGTIEIDGFAQYFTFGIKSKLSDKVFTFFQFNKLGASNIERIERIQVSSQSIRTKITDINMASSIADFGLNMGLIYKF